MTGDTSPRPGATGAGKQLRLQLWLQLWPAAQTTGQPGALPTSPRRSVGWIAVYPDLPPNCWGPVALPVILGMPGDGLTLWGLGNGIRLFSSSARNGTARHSPKGGDVPLGDTQIPSASLCPWWSLLGGDSDKLMSQLLQRPGSSAVRGDVGGFSGMPRCHPASLRPAWSVTALRSPQCAVSHPCPWVWTQLQWGRACIQSRGSPGQVPSPWGLDLGGVLPKGSGHARGSTQSHCCHLSPCWVSLP